MILIKQLFLILSLMLINSCNFWQIKDWNELQDRTFYLSIFEMNNYGVSNSQILSNDFSKKFVKNLDVGSMMKIFEKKYNITINIDDFLKAQNRSDWGFRSWYSGKKRKNYIKFQYAINKELQNDCFILIYSNGSLPADAYRFIYGESSFGKPLSKFLMEATKARKILKMLIKQKEKDSAKYLLILDH